MDELRERQFLLQPLNLAFPSKNPFPLPPFFHRSLPFGNISIVIITRGFVNRVKNLTHLHRKVAIITWPAQNKVPKKNILIEIEV
jgi:hypothetical protein